MFTVGAFVLPVLAILAVRPILWAADRATGRLHLTIMDLFTLVLYVSVTNGFLWPVFRGSGRGEYTMLLMYNLIGLAWWAILVVGVSRLNIVDSLPRMLYVGLAAPGSFCVLYYPIMTLFGARGTELRLSSKDWVRFVLCLVACAALFPVTRWVLRRARPEPEEMPLVAEVTPAGSDEQL